jgi:drug/metabolite transporter (DMT)-like permease
MFAALLIGEQMSVIQWNGVALGFFGLASAMRPKVQLGTAGLTLLASAIGGVACMAYASVYQKRSAEAGDPWTRTALMFVGATVPPVIIACAKLTSGQHLDHPLSLSLSWGRYAEALLPF